MKRTGTANLTRIGTLRRHLDVGRIHGLFIHIIVIGAITITISRSLDSFVGTIISFGVAALYIFAIMIFLYSTGIYWHDYGRTGAPKCRGGCRWKNSNITIGDMYALHYCFRCGMHKAVAGDGSVDKYWRREP